MEPAVLRSWWSFPLRRCLSAWASGLLRREWKAYQFGAAHKDDPSTWNDDPVEEELPADNGDEEDPL